jgi:hypothetical protein
MAEVRAHFPATQNFIALWLLAAFVEVMEEQR